MSPGSYLLGLIRVVVVLGAAAFAGHRLARRAGYGRGALGALATAVIAISIVLVQAELLGLVSELRDAPLVVSSLIIAGAAVAMGPGTGAPVATDPAVERAGGVAPSRGAGLWAAAAVVIAGTEWVFSTANALGGGMFNFDTLWYHMPFAAGYALSGSITGIHFTQADPWVAYYPANSELLHGVALVLLHSDFLSLFINLGWLAMLLLGSWCLGIRWGVTRQTLIAGCLVAGLPVMASTQPGEAFDDIAGVAALVAGAALLVCGATGRARLLAAGLALGLAFGSKFTFLIPAAVLVAGFAALAGRAETPAADAPVHAGTARSPGGWRRARPAAGPLVLGLLITGGWWYLHDLILIGNPLGLRLDLGPLTLPGPQSPLAAPFQQTVLSQLRHPSLWGSRFLPGLSHALGLVWPVILAAFVVALVVAARRRMPPALRVISCAAATATATYVLLPTGAAEIRHGTYLFEVNLRYMTPAFALGFILVVLTVAVGAPRHRRVLAPALVAVLAVTQFTGSLWPVSPGRHLVFGVVLALAVGAVLLARRAPWRPRPGRVRTALVLAGAVILLGASFAAQRHYLARRYQVGVASDRPLGVIFRWAAHISHTRLAVYGSLQQYPLYGRYVTNQVTYLGQPTPGGGYRPIADCATWRATIDRGHFRYLVLTPAPTAPVPAAWTASPAARPVLAPDPADVVYELVGPLDPSGFR